MWQRFCTIIGGLLLMVGLLGALRENHDEALAVSARMGSGQWGRHKGSQANQQEHRWARRQEFAFDLSLVAIAVGVALQTLAGAFPEVPD